MYNAKNGRIEIGGTDMDYIAFGSGRKNLIMIPGLGDGLHTVKGMASVLAPMYKQFAKDYRVYLFSRKNKLEEGYSSEDMARDLKFAMDSLCIAKADVMGVSQGGTIAQQFAVNYPEAVGKLVLVVTYSRQNENVQQCVGRWLEMARADNYRELFIDTAENSYTEAKLKKYRPLYPLLSKFGRPKNFDRFIIMAEACMTHDVYDKLGKITAPTLIIGGGCDKIVGSDAAAEMAAVIKDSELYIYEGYGHGVYEEAADFNSRVLEFLNR